MSRSVPPKHSPTAPAGAISLTFKSVKPAQTYTLSVHPADTIQTIKSQLAAEAGAPPADAQRLLLKGKALADAKLLKEYDVKDGDTVTLMVKPGFAWDPSVTATASSPSTAEPAPETEPPSITLVPESKTRSGHSRIPSVVLSPSPSLTAVTEEKLVDIPLVLDTSNIPSSSLTPPPETPYHTVLSRPEFWERLYTFLR